MILTAKERIELYQKEIIKLNDMFNDCKLLNVSTNTRPNVYTLIDNDDYDQYSEYKWHSSPEGYVLRKIKVNNVSQSHYLHREILQASKRLMVDHINHNPFDNRRVNLRLVTNRQNQYNSKPNEGRKYKGVYKHSKVDMWEARIGHEGKSLYLGLYQTQEQAATAYDVFANILFNQHYYPNTENHPKFDELIKGWTVASED